MKILVLVLAVLFLIAYEIAVHKIFKVLLKWRDIFIKMPSKNETHLNAKQQLDRSPYNSLPINPKFF